jgi:hypothetical protein
MILIHCLLLRGGVVQGVPCTASIFLSIVCSLSDFQPFVFHLPQLSGSDRQTTSCEAGEIWREMVFIFYLRSISFHTCREFNML